MKDIAPTISTFNHSPISDKTASFSLFKVTTTTVGFIFKTFLWLAFLGGTMLVCEMKLAEATNSDGEEIDWHFTPLIQQLKADRKLLLHFEPDNIFADTVLN